MTSKFLSTCLVIVAVCWPLQTIRGETFSLAGPWRFQLDRADIGVKEHWFEHALAGSIRLPGSLPEQKVGDDISLETKWMGDIQEPQWFADPIYAPYTKPGNFKFPFWLQPDKYYAGVAWYQRDFEVPPSWRSHVRRLVLRLERPHWETRVWIDGKSMGSNNSLFTPHKYDLGTELAAGRHQLTIRVDNRLIVDIGVNSHAITDHTQGNWNGIVGKIEFDLGPPFWIPSFEVYPNLKDKTVRVEASLCSIAGWNPDPAKFFFDLEDLQTHQKTHLGGFPGDFSVKPGDSAKGGFQVILPLGQFTNVWDEFNPRLYRLTLGLAADPRVDSGGPATLASTTFGLREVTAQGSQLLINGHKLFIRGTLECCIFPLTGHPPTDVESWKRIIRIAKAHGLNLIRFHSYCPPEAAFVAADELGFYYQVETCWANSSTSLGDGKPVDQWVLDETERIIKAYGNHPSFLLMPYGNEPGGSQANAYLAKYVARFKARDPRRLWTSGSGWPQLPENQFHVTPDPRIQAWGDGLKSRINARPPETSTDYRAYIAQRNVPVISHEIGQWCVYPNFDEIPKYTGYLKPKNFEIFRESLRAQGMGDQARTFLLASGRLQTLCYKEDIESALRTPGMGGFELLDLHDFPGQGTALVGVLDPFWDGKGYVTAQEFSRFCGPTVPLARLEKRVFTTAETFRAQIELAHFGPAPMPHVVPVWKLVGDGGKVVATGKLPARHVELGNGISLGSASIELSSVPAPARYRFVVGLEGTPFENDWDVWVYPPKVETEVPEGVTLAEALDDQTVASLNMGGKVLLLVRPQRGQQEKTRKVVLGFSSIFWNTAWTGRQPPHTLGILCDPGHPALALFPTDGHSNWQWWYVISRAEAMILDDLPRSLRPTVQVIDDWVTNHKLGLVFEARVGRGKLIVCSIDLTHHLDGNPVARQFRHSLLTYLAGSHCHPTLRLTPEEVSRVLGPARAQRIHDVKSVTADSAQPGYEPDNAIDSDPATLWHTSWNEPAPGFPHRLEFAFTKPLVIRGFTVLPRQDKNPNGWIKDYEFYASKDGHDWGAALAKGAFPATDELKIVRLALPVEARFARLVALSGHAQGPWASLAEFDVIE